MVAMASHTRRRARTPRSAPDASVSDLPVPPSSVCLFALMSVRLRAATDTGTCMGYGDVVEASGPALMVHAGLTAGLVDKPRTVRLPCTAAVVKDEAGAVVCQACDEFKTGAMGMGDVLLFEVGSCVQG